MGWTAYYQILRARPLDDAELAMLADFITHHNRPPWEGEGFGLAVTRAPRADRVVGFGWTRLAAAVEDGADQRRLCDVLTALPSVLRDVEVRVLDDFGCFGFDAATGVVSLDAATAPAPVELTDADREGFASPGVLIGPRMRPPSPDAQAVIDGAAPPTREALRAALIDHAALPPSHPARPALAASLAALPPRALALAGLDVHADIAADAATWRLVTHALEAVDDVAALVPGFLAVWSAPRSLYWYGELAFPDATLDALVAAPAVEARLLADVAAGLVAGEIELVHRRAEHAARLLGRGRSPVALLALLDAVRILRDGGMSAVQRYHTYPGLLAGLIRAEVPAVVPTLLLELGGGPASAHQRRDALAPLARLAPAQVSPLLVALAEAGEALWEVIPALAIVGDAAAIAALRGLCELPIAHERERAADALRGLGVEPPPAVAAPPAEALVTHRCGAVRERALRELDQRDDRALAVSLVAACALDAAIRRRAGDDVRHYRLPAQVLPEPLRRAGLDAQLAWLRGDGAATLPPQIVWPSVRAIVDGADVAALAAAVPPPWPPLDAAAVEVLRAEEAAVIAALRAGRTDGLARAAAPVPAGAPPAPAAGLIDDLLSALAGGPPFDADLIQRTGLPRELLHLDRWQLEATLRTALVALGPAEVGARLVARLTELHESPAVRELAEQTLPEAARDPAIARRLAEVLDLAHDEPWTSPARAADFLAPVASTPEVFARALDEIAAPDDGPRRGRSRDAFDVVAAAVDRRDQAAAALVARVRADRGRPCTLTGWRGDAYRALRRLGAPDAVATAILELAEPAAVGAGADLLALIAAGDGTTDVLARAVDLPGLARAATRELGRACGAGDDLRARYLAHPFWKVRLAAAGANPSWERARAETCAVWATIDAARLPIPDHERAAARPVDAPPGATWADLARAHGAPATVPPLPSPRDGLASACADHRAWSIAAVDDRLDPADLVARVLADELDVAMVARGHGRNPPRWDRWRERVPGLPADRRGRRAWARAQVDASLPPALVRVRDGGADAVAAELPRPYLVLAAAERARLEAVEAPIADRGLALLRDGVAS